MDDVFTKLAQVKSSLNTIQDECCEFLSGDKEDEENDEEENEVEMENGQEREDGEQ